MSHQIPREMLEKRTQAMENLVCYYLSEKSPKEMRAPISMTNHFKIEFDKPPTQPEIDHLIEVLQLTKKVLPKSRDERSAEDVLNEALRAHDQEPIQRKEISD